MRGYACCDLPLFHPLHKRRWLPHTASMSQVVGGVPVKPAIKGKRWVLVLAPVLLVIAGLFAWATGNREPVAPQQDAGPAASACASAASDKLQPLITLWSGEAKFKQVQGSEWQVSTSVNHKTKWVDNWYDVTCVVQLPQTVVSVRAVPR